MTTVKDFINLGWYTVPLKGELIRLEHGQKTVPIFPLNWRVLFTAVKNKSDAYLGCVLTGKISNVIALDCDNQMTFDLFRSLDFSNKFFAESVGKEGGTIFYQYDEEVTNSFKLNASGFKLDLFSNNGSCYLPTSKNKTKNFEGICTLTKMPKIVKSLILRFESSLYGTNKERDEKIAKFSNSLAPILEQFVSFEGKFIANLFKTLTPKSFRDYDQYVKNRYLHPREILPGSRSNYLVKVSAILGADKSVDADLYAESLNYINNLLSKPRTDNELNNQFITPMLTGRSKIQGESIWQYDENWRTSKSIFKTKQNTTVEIVYDPDQQEHFLVDLTLEKVYSFQNSQKMMDFVASMIAKPLKKSEILRDSSLVEAVNQPNLEFGFIENNEERNTRVLNMFKPTDALRIFYDPKSYEDKYVYPTETLNFFQSFIPDDKMRNYLLSFLKTKFVQFDYSPVVLFFMGINGSGKSLFTYILRAFVGSECISSPEAKHFLEKFNSYIKTTLFLELDEYGDSLTNAKQKQEALALIKSISGKDISAIRSMQSDLTEVKHNTTIIMTCNSVPLVFSENDRRIAYFDTPNILKEQEWVFKMGGTTFVTDRIKSTVNDFAYYLATEVQELDADQYVNPPLNKSKQELILRSLPDEKKIAYCLSIKKIDYLLEQCSPRFFSLPQVAIKLKEGKISLNLLGDLFLAMTSHRGYVKDLSQALKDSNERITIIEENSEAYIINFLEDETL